MIQAKTPLEVIAALSKSTSLDIDTNQANRYCIKLNNAIGKEAYYFGTPIYNIYSRKLINRKIVITDGCYRYVGSNCEVMITATQLKLIQDEKLVCIQLGKTFSWTLRDGILFSDGVSVIPTYNGILINGKRMPKIELIN